MTYMQLAALELSLLALLGSLAGLLIVLRQRSFFAVALSHATFPGGVIFAIAGLNLLIGQALFAMLLVLLMTVLSRVPGQGKQVTSGVVLSLGFALGALLSGLVPGVPVEALLIGSPLGVTRTDVAATAIVLFAIVVVFGIFWRRILFQTFDPAGFTAAGFRTWPIELVVTGVIAAAVVVSMPAVGAILSVAVLVAPTAAARALVKRVEWIPPLAALIGVGGSLAGLWISREFGVAAGGAVGLVLSGLFLVALIIRTLRRRGSATLEGVGRERAWDAA